MTALLRMDEDQSHMTERIFNLTLEIICLLTGESFPPVKSGDHVTITVPPPHFLISEGHNKILEITRKMMELLTGEEQQYIDEHQDLYKDAMMENQLPLTSPDGSSNRNPPERCTGPLYSQDCQQEDHTIPHHYQGGELVCVSAVVKEEEEKYMRSDQQSVEGDDMMRTYKEEEEERCVRSDQQSIEEGDMMRTYKEEEEETYVRSDQQSMEEGDMMRTYKEEEEETYVRSDQQSIGEEDMMGTCKEEDNVTEGRTGFKRNPRVQSRYVCCFCPKVLLGPEIAMMSLWCLALGGAGEVAGVSRTVHICCIRPKICPGPGIVMVSLGSGSRRCGRSRGRVQGCPHLLHPPQGLARTWDCHGVFGVWLQEVLEK
ncbi:uncharacterized protein [Hyperolius riggenbachi]|uniref:uncharacterized protein n=1 Tax=Hyperolius riggenbachi TaxID=752182 RepID=UPI0035A280A3